MSGPTTEAPTGGRLRDQPAFRWLVAARWTDTIGNAVAPIALAFAVLDLTGSATDVGIVVGARSAAMVVFILLGGVLADRLGRSVVLVWSNVVARIGQAVVAWLVLGGTATIPSLVALSAVHGAAGAMSLPASAAMVPATVPRPLLQRANAFTSAGVSTVNLLGLVAGAGLVAAIGPGWGLAVDAASFVVTAALFARLGSLVPATRSSESPLDQLRAGWRTFSRTTWLWTVVLGFLVINAVMAGALGVLGPTVADASFGRARWGWILAAEAGGAVMGSLLASRSSRAMSLSRSMAVSALLAPWLVGLGTTASVPVLVLLALGAGIGFGIFEVGWDLAVQGTIPEEQLSRVHAFDMLGSMLTIPIGQVAAGPLAATLGTRATLVAFGVLAAVTCLVVALLTSVRRVRVEPSPVSRTDEMSGTDVLS